jgi:hypothetical protein
MTTRHPSNRLPARRATLALLLAAAAPAAAAPGDPDPALYPRKLTEIKAMLDVLAPDGPGPRDLQHVYLQLAGLTQPVECVDGWMNDSDPSNIAVVGHRRWCLNPRMLKSAFGADGNYAAMHAHDGSRKQVPDWDIVAYPARGWMPAELFGPRHAWSVSLNPDQYAPPAKAEVKAEIRPAGEKGTPDGAPLRLDYFNVDNGGFGTGAAVIFRPEGTSFKTNQRYAVEITGLKTKLTQAALGYRDLAQAYKETRAGQRAAEDFKRLQAALQPGPGAGGG